MSYEIIYKAFTIKKDNTFIPMVVMGSNNCYEVLWHGRQRRERDIFKPKFFFKDKKCNFKSLYEMEQYFKSDIIKEEMNNGNLQGRFKTPKGLIKAFQKYVFDSNDLKLKPYFISLYYFKSLHNGTEEEETQIKEIFNRYLKDRDTVLTEEEMEELINNCFKEIDENTVNKLLKWRTKEQLICYNYSTEEYNIEHNFRDLKNSNINNKINPNSQKTIWSG